MTTSSRPDRTPSHSPRTGLIVRLWFACLAGALATALASLSVISAIAMAGAALDPTLVMRAIGAACLLGLLVAVLAGRWLTRGIAHRLRDVEHGIGRGHVPESAYRHGWGEIGDVARAVRALLETDRDLREDEAELRALRGRIEHARDVVDRWIRTERWEALAPGSGSLAPLAEALDRAMAREIEVQDQNLEAVQLVQSELLQVIDEARGSAEMAEHGYVEITALLTTIREIARLTAEIQQAVQAPAVEPKSPVVESDWRDRAAQAIEELVDVSGESVRRLGEGLLRVREINEQVQLLSNRATLIALNAVVASARPEPPAVAIEGSTTELKQLAREVRASTERVAALSSEIDHAVESANQRMREVREHVVTRLVELPAPPAAASAPPMPPLLAHWADRLREMVQDAARKGERVSESQERVSSAVQRTSRRLEDEIRDLEGLVARLTPSGATHAIEGSAPSAASDAEPQAREARTLRLFDKDASARPAEPPAGHEGGA
jgi:methyl-accepting chemotaxis protein